MAIKILEHEGLTFDDVLIVPKRSSVHSRRDVSLRTRLFADLTLELPLISANMDTVTEGEMARAMHALGGLGIIHRFVADPIAHGHLVASVPGIRIVTIGVKPEDMDRIAATEAAHGVLIDVAHGHSDRVIETILAVRERFPDLGIIAGNVATPEGTWDLLEAGAHAIKVGVGPGAVCTTRIVTGAGMPQLTAIMRCRAALDRWYEVEARKARPRAAHRPTLIADGGIRNSGDIVKALAAGADSVMIGSLFAGTDEAPGDTLVEHDRAYKVYRGMASAGAQRKVGIERTPEGISTLIPTKGPVAALVRELEGGIRSGLSYVNARSIPDLHAQTIEFVRVTGAGQAENRPHAATRLGAVALPDTPAAL